MGNKRTTYVLGATLVSIGFVFGMVWSIPGAFSDVTVEDTSLLVGHATIMFTDPDGSVKYIQTDNAVHDDCLSGIINDLTGGKIGAAGGPYTTINFYTGSVPTSSDSEPAGILTVSQNSAVYALTNAATDTAALGFTATFITATVTIADTGQFVETVALTDGGGNACSSLTLDGTPDCTGAGCGIITGTTIDVAYTINLTS